MVYIYKKVVGNKKYYYLRASLRKDGKNVSKDIAYLGTNPSKIKEKLSQIPTNYQKAIRKTYKTIHKFLEINYYLEKVKEKKLKTNNFLSKDLLNDIEACKLHWLTFFNKLDENSKDEILYDFIVEFSYNTTSLEGNTITLKEAEKLLLDQRTPKNRSLREIYDLQNSKNIFFKHYENPNKKITHELMQEIHDNLIENIDVRKGYRTKDIRVTKSRFNSSPAQYVKTDMELLLKWLESNKNLHPLVLASLFHHKFEKIHPFFDGNGRTGRMLANIILLKNDYPPLMIRKKKRTNYLNALSDADDEDIMSNDKKSYNNLIEFVAKEFTENYWNIFL